MCHLLLFLNISVSVLIIVELPLKVLLKTVEILFESLRILFKKREEAYMESEEDARADAVKRAEGFQPRRKLAEALEDQ